MEIKRTKFNLSILGETQVGKTCILSVYKGVKFNEKNLSTIGMDTFIDLVNIEGQEYKFKIFDTNGQERYNSISSSTIKFADGFLVVFSVDKKSSFEKIVNWIKVIENSVDIREKAVILVGNKIDKPEREVSNEEALSFAKRKKLKYYETSAKTGFNIKEVFNEIYKDIYLLNIDNGSILEKDIDEEKNHRIENIQIKKSDFKKKNVNDENANGKCCSK